MKILHFIIYFKFINHSLHFYIKKNYFLKTNHVEQRGFAVGNEVSNLYTSDTMITRGEWGLIRIHIVLYSWHRCRKPAHSDTNQGAWSVMGKQVECLFVRAFVYVKRVYERVRTALITSLSPLSIFGCCLKEVPVSPPRKDVYSGHSYSILNHPM